MSEEAFVGFDVFSSIVYVLLLVWTFLLLMELLFSVFGFRHNGRDWRYSLRDIVIAFGFLLMTWIFTGVVSGIVFLILYVFTERRAIPDFQESGASRQAEEREAVSADPSQRQSQRRRDRRREPPAISEKSIEPIEESESGFVSFKNE
jgi:energy-coupling factor transporter transmembrane protein EcfT